MCLSNCQRSSKMHLQMKTMVLYGIFSSAGSNGTGRKSHSEVTGDRLYTSNNVSNFTRALLLCGETTCALCNIKISSRLQLFLTDFIISMCLFGCTVNRFTKCPSVVFVTVAAQFMFDLLLKCTSCYHVICRCCKINLDYNFVKAHQNLHF